VPQKPALPSPAGSASAEPGGDGTTATISTCLGDITFELFTRSAPVASANFAGLAEGGYYDGVVFHRLVPGFVIQGGDGEFGDIEAYDPRRVGSGGPGYTIPDEPFAGRYGRGIVAMARSSEPNSQGSQFFIVLDDEAEEPLEFYRTYVIFGRVTQGMEVVDRIAAMPNSGEPANQALQPVPMSSVRITRP
jgi:cyclophilin family peptidyl-prolyl cis-trans isomerase